MGKGIGNARAHAQEVVRFEYSQTLSTNSNAPSWSEELQISVRIFAEAITSGWLGQNFGDKKSKGDFLLLIAIIMHARPLRGEDFQQLKELGLATDSDEGRLYTRITDTGLADELQWNRETISAGAKRLAEKGFITILDLKVALAQAGKTSKRGQSFKDSKGRYDGRYAFLVAGDIAERMAVKDIQPRDHAGFSDMDSAVHVGESSMVQSPTMLDNPAPPPSTMLDNPAGGAGLSSTNEEEEEEDEDNKIRKEMANLYRKIVGEEPGYPQISSLVRAQEQYAVAAQGQQVQWVSDALYAAAIRAKDGKIVPYALSVLKKRAQKPVTSGNGHKPVGGGNQPAQLEMDIDQADDEEETGEFECTPTANALSIERWWQSLLGQLQADMPLVSYNTWVADTCLVDYDPDMPCVTIAAPSQEIVAWLENRLTTTISRQLSGMLNRPDIQVKFVVAADWQARVPQQ